MLNNLAERFHTLLDTLDRRLDHEAPRPLFYGKYRPHKAEKVSEHIEVKLRVDLRRIEGAQQC